MRYGPKALQNCDLSPENTSNSRSVLNNEGEVVMKRHSIAVIIILLSAICLVSIGYAAPAPSIIVDQYPACLTATEEFSNGDLVWLDVDDIISGENMNLIMGQVNGNVVTGGDLDIYAYPGIFNEVTIYGDAIADGEILMTDPDSVFIHGTAYEYAEVGPITVPQFFVDYGVSNLTMCDGVLAPGDYDEVIIKNTSPSQNNCSVTLSPGVYTFRRLDVQALDVVFNVDHTCEDGATILMVEEYVHCNLNCNLGSGTAVSDFIVYTNQSNVSIYGQAFSGHLIAPYATVKVDMRVKYYGCIYAESISFGERSELIGDIPLDLEQWEPPGQCTCPSGCDNPIHHPLWSFFSTSSKCFEIDENIHHWFAWRLWGKTIEVNGERVYPGQMPLPEPINGKYYFYFSAGWPFNTGWFAF